MIKSIFKSRDGKFRLLWRLSSYIFLFLFIDIAAQMIRGALNGSDTPSLAAELACVALSIPGVIGLTFLFRKRLDKQPWQGMALPNPRKRWLDLAAGGIWTLILMPAPLIVLAMAVGQVHFVGTEAAESGLAASLLYVFAGWINAFGIGLIEELAIRGYVMQNLAERFPLWVATIFTGLIFGLLHFWGGLSLAKVLEMAAFSTVFVVLRICTGSLWAAIGLHTMYNWLYTSLLGFSSSDGGYMHSLLHFDTPMGSEVAAPVNPWLGDIGSIIPNLVAFGVVVAILLIWNWRRKQPVDWRSKLDGNGEIVLPLKAATL